MRTCRTKQETTTKQQNNTLYSIKTRKRDRAQHVARPASCANSTVHFLLTYRLTMLLPSSEWPLNTSTEPILAYLQSPLMQMYIKIWGVTGPTFTKFVALHIVNFSSTVLTQQSALRSVHPLSNERGDIKKGSRKQNISPPASQCRAC